VPEILLECAHVNHWFKKSRVLYDINLKIARGQFVALVGESGCGKSTLLRALLGTHPPTDGAILMNGQPVLHPGRDRGIVYQRYSLFPYLTALQNVAYGLMVDQFGPLERIYRFFAWRKARKDHLEQASALLTRFGLQPEHQEKYPSQLSGGQCQRVAIAQALIMKPQLLLMDEPFGALDEATREDQRQTLAELYQENIQARIKGEPPQHTLVMVTHELNEAIIVADRIIALSREWRWRDEPGLTEHPGATVVYDASSPPLPRDPVANAEDFRRQRAEIRQAAFNPDEPTPRNQYVRFWQEHAEGKGVGVMQPTVILRRGAPAP
jgi:NitT/TauT family transport system ATP-binding protein